MRQLSLLLFFGCSDYTLQDAEKVPAGAKPSIEVEPMHLFFQSATETLSEIQNFSVSNVGDTTLEISDMTVVGNQAFAITAIAGSSLLEPGESQSVAVTYAPDTAGTEDEGAVLIFSNDPYNSGVEVTLGGSVRQPLLLVEPYILDMGSVPIDTEITDSFVLKSIGDAPVTISAIDIPGTIFSYDSNLVLPFTLAIGEERVFDVSFFSSLGGQFEESIFFYTEAPAFDVTTNVVAEAQTGTPIAVCEVDPSPVQPNGGTATWYGSDSYDEEGFAIVNHTWTLMSKPGGSTASMSNGGANRDFMPDLAGEYVARLVVTNELGIQSDPCEVVLDAVPGQDLWVQMYWTYAGDDMDLHLVQQGGTLNSSTDCYYGNCVGGMLDWGVLGDPSDNPSLDLDDIQGTGPENINMSNPANGTYEVYVHDYPGSTYDAGNPVTVVVYIGGSMVWSDTRTITGENSSTPFASISWPSGTVTGL